jgi:predicted MFS family arabinose efflux permease
MPGWPPAARPARDARRAARDARRAGRPGPAVRRARLAVAFTFAVNGAVFGTWAARVPAVKDRLGLSPGVLGLALVGLALGGILAMPAAGALVARHGSRPVTRAALAACCLALPLPALAPGVPALALGLLLLGAGNGAVDVAMNAHGVVVEERYARPILSSFHGLWSLGALAGAAAGGLAAGAGVPVGAHLAAAGGVLLAVGLAATWWLLPAGADRRPAGPGVARPTRPLAVLAAIAFCGLLAEDAAAQWSAVYLRDALGTSAALAATGYAAFSLAMTAGRLAGDRLVARLQPARFVRLAALLASAGLGLGLAAGHPAAAVAGFTLLGAGISCIVPVAFSAAPRVGGAAGGPAIAAVSTAGYLGGTLGPPAIGGLAELAGLPAALGLVAALTGLVALLAGGIPPTPDGTTTGPRGGGGP